MALFSYLYTMEIKDMQALIEENKRLQAQIEKLSDSSGMDVPPVSL